MTGLSIQIYLLFMVLILQIKESQGNSCLPSLPTLAYVKRCPKTQDEWDAASSRKQCNMLSGKHSCASFVYHCLLNQWGNATVEVCAPTWYLSGFCAMYNIKEARVIDNFNVDCTNFTVNDRCPTRYISTQIFKYPVCYQKNEIIYSKNNTQTRPQNQANPNGDEEKSCQGKVPFIVLFCVALGVSGFLSLILILIRKGVLWKTGKRGEKEFGDNEKTRFLHTNEQNGERGEKEFGDNEKTRLLHTNEQNESVIVVEETTDEINERKKYLEKVKDKRIVTMSPLKNSGLNDVNTGNRKPEELSQKLTLENETIQKPTNETEDSEKLDVTAIDEIQNQDTVFTGEPNSSAEEVTLSLPEIEDNTESEDISDQVITSDKNTSMHEDSSDGNGYTSQNLSDNPEDEIPSANETALNRDCKTTLETENEDETLYNKTKNPHTQKLIGSGEDAVNNRPHENPSEILTEEKITEDSKKDKKQERKGVRALTKFYEPQN